MPMGILPRYIVQSTGFTIVLPDISSYSSRSSLPLTRAGIRTEGVDGVANDVDTGAGVSDITAGSGVVAGAGARVFTYAGWVGAGADVCAGAGCMSLRAAVSETGAGDSAAIDPGLSMGAEVFLDVSVGAARTGVIDGAFGCCYVTSRNTTILISPLLVTILHRAVHNPEDPRKGGRGNGGWLPLNTS